MLERRGLMAEPFQSAQAPLAKLLNNTENIYLAAYIQVSLLKANKSLKEERGKII